MGKKPPPPVKKTGPGGPVVLFIIVTSLYLFHRFMWPAQIPIRSPDITGLHTRKKTAPTFNIVAYLPEYRMAGTNFSHVVREGTDLIMFSVDPTYSGESFVLCNRVRVVLSYVGIPHLVGLICRSTQQADWQRAESRVITSLRRRVPATRTAAGSLCASVVVVAPLPSPELPRLLPSVSPSSTT